MHGNAVGVRNVEQVIRGVFDENSFKIDDQPVLAGFVLIGVNDFHKHADIAVVDVVIRLVFQL